jgi:hypothetical protein
LAQEYTLKKLRKPYHVSTAISKKKEENSQNLDHYCKLRFVSTDNVWRSCTIDALVCPGLQTDIILGLDFLVKNKIVVDAELRSAVNKDSNYDLLNPPRVDRQTHMPVMSPKVRRCTERRVTEEGRRVYKQKMELVLAELVNRFKEKPEKFDFHAHTIDGPDIVCLVKTRIVELARQEELLKLDKKWKKDFEDRFPKDIPHVDELPKDVYHHMN